MAATRRHVMHQRPARVARVASCLLLLAAGFVVLRIHAQPMQTVIATADRLPRQLEAWDGADITVPDRTVDLLETNDVITREYRHRTSGEPVWLAVVGGLNTRTAFHPPELCYVGSNYEIQAKERRHVRVQGAQATDAPAEISQLRVRNNQQELLVWYWFTAGERLTPSYYRQQLWLVGDAIRHRRTQGRLMRISTRVEHGNVHAAEARLSSFIGSIAASLRHLDTPPRDIHARQRET